MSYLIFDTETSGLPKWSLPLSDPAQPRICQLACLLLDSEFNEVASFASLVKSDGWIIEEGAYNAHGISNEDCDKYGIEIEQVTSVFDNLANNSSYIVAHNIRFDSFLYNIECIRQNIGMFNWEEQGICTMLSSTPVCKLPKSRGSYKWPKLQEAYTHMYGEEFKDAHNALADCKATAKVFQWLVQHGHILNNKNLTEVNI